MQLIIIGSGTCVPQIKRGSPANFLKIGKNNILIDCGPGTIRQMLKAGISYKDINYVFLTHFHNDHVNDVMALLHALRWTPGYKRKKQLVLAGPKGLKRFFKRLTFNMKGDFSIDKRTFSCGYKVKLVEIARMTNFPGFIVDCCKTPHGNPSTAYRFEEDASKKRLVVSGDSEFDKSLISFSRDCDLLLFDASATEKSKLIGHMTAKSAAVIAKEANAKKLLLTHFYPVASGKERLREAKKEFKNTALAKDLMKINI